jgi:hypothetical protein
MDENYLGSTQLRPVVADSWRRLPHPTGVGGYNQSGIGRENHKMMLDHYQQTKNLLVSQQQGSGLLLTQSTRWAPNRLGIRGLCAF